MTDPAAIAAGLTEARDKATEKAIADFNAEGRTEDFYGHQSRVHARRPILATDCDYEIVRISGVQGIKLTDDDVRAHLEGEA